MIYAEIQRDVPTTLAAWEVVDAKLKSNDVTVSGQSARAQNRPKVDDDEFASLSQQLHRNLAPSAASASLPATLDVTATSNGGKWSKPVVVD